MVADFQARNEALNIQESFIMQAPAGSGKTEILTQRVLGLLAHAQTPEEILAITFTRKAAGEMHERIMSALLSATGPEPAKDPAKTRWSLACASLRNSEARGWDILNHGERLQLLTIDALCLRLASSVPLLALMGGTPEIAPDASGLHAEAAERIIHRLEDSIGSADSPVQDEPSINLSFTEAFDPALSPLAAPTPLSAALATLLRHLDNRPTVLRDMLVVMLSRRDQWLRHINNGQNALREPLEAALASVVGQTLAKACVSIPEGLRSEILRLGRVAANTLREAGESSPILGFESPGASLSSDTSSLSCWHAACELLLTAKGEIRKTVNKKQGFAAGRGAAAEVKEAMAGLLEALSADEEAAKALRGVSLLPAPVYGDGQWVVLEALLTVLPAAVLELRRVFRLQRKVDYIEVSQAALLALGSVEAPTDLTLHLGYRPCHILIDEFQDTSLSQWNLLERLTAGWTPGDGRTLFVVGDPMQSVYRFREADVALFLKAKNEGIGSLRPTFLGLTCNFRSQANIVDWANEAFAVSFPAAEEAMTGAVPYSPATATQEGSGGCAVAVHPMAAKDDEKEALKAMEIIRSVQAGDAKATIAVLVRARSHAGAIMSALRDARIRYQAQEMDPLAERPCVLDALALTRAVLHLGDKVAWLACLRAPWCGLTLSDLHALVGDERDKVVLELLGDPARFGAMSADGQARAKRAANILGRTADMKGRMSLRRLIEGAWLALGAPAYLSRGDIQDVQAFFGLLEKEDHGGDLVALDGLEDKLAKLYAGVDPEADGRVQIMTIHKSKGLEFGAVILPGLGKTTRPPESPLLRWLETRDGELLLAPVSAASADEADPVYRLVGQVEKEREENEALRLFYVGATRAKDQLHLIGNAKIDDEGEATPAKGSLLARVWPAVQTAFEGLQAGEGEAVLEPEAAVGGHLWRVASAAEIFQI